ncbi:MAG: hypothetical protein U0528_13930 [Anaerolineae bacterium]
MLAHILNKPYTQMLAEFKDPVFTRRFRDDLGWTGDVVSQRRGRCCATAWRRM